MSSNTSNNNQGRDDDDEAKRAVVAQLVGNDEASGLISDYTRAVLIADAHAKIKSAAGATAIEVVLQELGKYPQEKNVCAVGIDKLLSFIKDEPDCVLCEAKRAKARSILDATAAGQPLEFTLGCMDRFQESQNIQTAGAKLLSWFVSSDPNTQVVLKTERSLQTLLGAAHHFPDNVKLQAAVWNLMCSLQQACVSSLQALNEPRGIEVLATNLIQANGLPLALATLERHFDNDVIVMGVLAALNAMASFPATRVGVARAFVRDHPNLRALVNRVMNTRERGGDSMYVHREAFLVLCAFDQL